LTEAIVLFGDSLRHPNILWRTRFWAPDPVVYIESGERRILLVGAMELGRAQKESNVSEVRQFDQATWRKHFQEGGEMGAYAAAIAEIVNELGGDRVVVEEEFPLALARALELKDVVVEASADLFYTERRRKTPEEQEAVAASQAAAVEAMQAARRLLRGAEIRDGKLWYQGAPLTSDLVIAAIEQELLRHGCRTEDTIVAAGPGAADPHVGNTGHLDANTGVIVDIFPSSKKTGYFGDITRTYVVGEPPEAWLKMYDAVKAAHMRALEVVRAGVTGRDVHRAVCQVLYDAGYGAASDGFRREEVAIMNHGTGHGVGLMVHEAPRLNDLGPELREGDVVTIEPGLYSPTDGSVRLENTVVVTADGYRELTHIDYEWRP
jgi:Xaa-Pro aminopeptidase